ncbi:MAG TPA: dehydrogenase E1 component subunit alpha/beta [Candidatus Dormibacteraeota bacterium]|nr:dehydrogenase E1 component subunit alpha/beta [Candidatus Dormibacteraeota bacterium]
MPTATRHRLDLHRAMLRIRRFEERASELYRDGEIPGFLHLSIGQEAVAAGVCSRLRTDDAVVSTHRGHGHCLAKGADMAGMFAELMGRESGTCHGRGGSMHIAELGAGVYGANGIVGAGLPIATGAGAAFQVTGTDSVVVAFFGEGAVAQGAFHEALNLATLWRLPVLFLCENNGFAEFSRLQQQQTRAPADRAAAYGLDGQVVDGNDVLAVEAAVAAILPELRAGNGPRFLEARTLRAGGHYEGDQQRYRSEQERAAWQAGDPIARSAASIDQAGGAGELAGLAREVEAEIEAALATARSGPAPDPAAVTSYTVRDFVIDPQAEDPSPSGEPFRYLDALREALADELEADPKVWLAGVDIAAGGGVFAVTKGLADRFPSRVRDTPISETAVMGLGVGGGLAGTRPVVELMYLDFLGVCFDQLLNQAAKLHFMTGGAASVPMVVRTQFGAGRSSGPQHSQSLESLLAQVPGLKVVMPSEPADAYGLLRAAIRDPNPVVFIENRLLYGLKGPRPRPGHMVPIGSAAVRREGRHVTVVSWSRMVHEALAAAESVEADGIGVEVIDLRSVAPIDWPTIARSVAKTGRLLVAHEAVLTSGIGAEIAARAAGEMFWDLDAPVVRVAPPFSPVPYAHELEEAWLPAAAEIAEAVRRLAGA